jgi:hypothetical protein
MDLLGSVVAANPCPPLPLKCTRRDPANDRLVEGFANTHHVLMQAYAFAMQRNCTKDNLQREQTQTDLTNVFVNVFRGATNNGNVPEPEELYTAATTFTRAYIHSFMPNRPVPDARFAPYEEISFNTHDSNPVVKASCEHLAGMIFYDEYPDTGPETVFDENGCNMGFKQEHRSYADVLNSLKMLPFSEILCKYAAVHRERHLLHPGIEILE